MFGCLCHVRLLKCQELVKRKKYSLDNKSLLLVCQNVNAKGGNRVMQCGMSEPTAERGEPRHTPVKAF